jgi:hypothetical protein
VAIGLVPTVQPKSPSVKPWRDKKHENEMTGSTNSGNAAGVAVRGFNGLFAPQTHVISTLRHTLTYFPSVFKIDSERKICHFSGNEQEGFKALSRQGVIGGHL